VIILLAVVAYILFVFVCLAFIFGETSEATKEEADRQFEIRRSIADAYIASANAKARQQRQAYEEEGDE
jgi:hypothetical protein